MNKKKLIDRVSFPDFTVSDAEKAQDDFGLSVAKAIEYEWFNRSEGGGCTYYNNREKYHILRLYGRGEQSTEIYKKLINGDSDESYGNFDWRPIQVIPKFVKLIVNQMNERLFNVRSEATDRYSTDLKNSYKEDKKRKIIAKPVIEEAKKILGVELFSETSEDDPTTIEELDLHMKLEYKPAIEIATEEAINFTLSLNDYDEIQKKLIKDIVEIGILGVKHYTDPIKGICVKYVDPANMVYSYPSKNNFGNVHYYGEVIKMTISELKRISDFSDEELKEFAMGSGEWANYHNNSNDNYTYRNDDFEGTVVDVLSFSYTTHHSPKYKKKKYKSGFTKINKKSSNYKGSNNSSNDNYEILNKKIDVWYEGMLILGTNRIFNYKLCENMIRDKGNLNKTLPPYLMYAPDLYQNRTRSLVETVIPYVDQMQQIHIKIQQAVANARPNGIYMDIDGLTEVNLGDGNVLTPLEIIKIYNQTGNVIGTSVTEEGDFNHGKVPIQELNNGIVSGVEKLINLYNHYLNLVRDSIGMAQGVDASTPHPKMAVGVQQQLALNSNTATRHILDSVLVTTERLGEALYLRLKDIFKYSNLKEVYVRAIGTNNVNVLKAIENYHLHDLGIHIELKPDMQEKQILENNINNALAKDLITLEDSIDIKNINNIKLANEVLKTKRKRRDKERKEHEKEVARINGENQVRATEAASKTRQLEMNQKQQIDLSIIEAKKQSELEVINAQEAAKSRLMKQEFEYNMVKEGINTERTILSEKYKEDRKDTRQDRHNTQASKMIEQRNKNTGSINFESKNDNLDLDSGLSLDEFEPR